ncbi:MAG: hypothetical protein RSG54_08260 [Clostridium sp.]
MQEIVPEPYTLYNKEQDTEEVKQKNAALRDFEYFHSMYPAKVKGLQLLVEEICDEMDYRESPMYDEYPDRMMVEQLCSKVTGQVTERIEDSSRENSPREKIQPEEREEVEIYSIPHMPHGPEYIIQSLSQNNGAYHTWEMTEGWQPSPSPCSWCPPPPPPPVHPWLPPSPPPPVHPWLPPPPPQCPCGQQPCSGDPIDLDDMVRVLLFNEMQKRRCQGRNCR